MPATVISVVLFAIIVLAPDLGEACECMRGPFGEIWVYCEECLEAGNF